MSSSHSRGPLPSQGSTMTQDELQRARYLAHMERRARPPTFRPLTIVVVVLSLGLFVIGLVMIVIAHWPGVSGGNSLKIAGGILLAVGGVIFIIALIVSCVLRNRERQRFEKSLASLQASRSNISVISRRTAPTTPTPSLDAKPGKSILKKTPSTSTYGTNRGSVFGEDDSGVGNAYNTSFGQNHSYEQGSTNSDTSAGKYEVYRIETLPDPSQARHGKNGMLPQSPLSGSGGLGNNTLSAAGVLDHSSTDSEAQVLPTPVRNTKRRRAQSPSVSSAGRPNPSYSPDAGEMAVARETHTQSAAPPAGNTTAGRAIQHYSNEGYDMYEGDAQASVPQVTRKTKSSSKDSEKIEKRQKKHTAKQSGALAPDAGYTGVGAGAGFGASAGYSAGSQYPSAYQNQAFITPEADLGHSAMQQTASRHQSRYAQQAHNTSASEELRINIKAQPGTAVHITPTATRVTRPVTSPSESSVETEI